MRKVYFSAFQSECSICSRLTAKILTNEREKRSLLRLFHGEYRPYYSKMLTK